MKELVAGKSSESIFNKALKKRRYNRAFFGEVFAIGAFHMKLIKVREEEYKVDVAMSIAICYGLKKTPA